MARTLKKTRARGLPPTLLLSRREDATGSFPSIHRTSTDNRTGRYPVLFNDRKVIQFNQTVTDISFPLGMTEDMADIMLAPEDKVELLKVEKVDVYWPPGDVPAEVIVSNTPLKGESTVKRGIADSFVTFTPGQVIEPFSDTSHLEGDAKLTNNPFYATGSAVKVTGDGFQQPLWDKTKIEIPLNVDIPTTFGQSTYKYQDSPMAYYDHTQKTFVPIGNNGTNTQLINYDPTTGTSEYFASKSIGFSPSTYGHFGNGAGEKQAARLFATPVNSFGFPYDAKRYAVPESPSSVGALNTNKDMLFSMENVLSEPFLLEKIVLEFTGAMSSSGMDDSGFCAMSTFFILNQTNTNLLSQRKAYTAFLLASEVSPSTGAVGPYPGYAYNLNTGTVGIDLVTYLQVAALTSSLALDKSYSTLKPQFERDLNVYQEATKAVNLSYGLNPNFGYSGSFVASASVRSPTAYDYSNIFRYWAYLPSMSLPSMSKLYINWHWLDNRYGGRKSLPEPCGRNWKETLASQNPAEIVNVTGSYFIATQDKTCIDNPYVLLPTDKLVFGWQAPLASVSGSESGDVGDGPQLHFPVGQGKLILYGSSLRLNPDTNQLEEYHDTLNQLLTSTSIHEVISS